MDVEEEKVEKEEQEAKDAKEDKVESKEEPSKETEEKEEEPKEKETEKSQEVVKEKIEVSTIKETNKATSQNSADSAAVIETNGIDNEDSINLTIGEDEENLLAEEVINFLY